MAAVNGLPLLSATERNPMLTTTYGTGELILHAIEHGYREFIIGIGGSATNDAGLGMLQALGFRFTIRMEKFWGREVKSWIRLSLLIFLLSIRH